MLAPPALEREGRRAAPEKRAVLASSRVRQASVLEWYRVSVLEG